MAILICMAALTASMSAEAQKSNSYKNAALENIATRTSVRSYLNKPVEAAQIEQLLRAGMAAPSAVNKQPWHFVVVTDKAQLAALAKANPHAGMAAKAPNSRSSSSKPIWRRRRRSPVNCGCATSAVWWCWISSTCVRRTTARRSSSA